MGLIGGLPNINEMARMLVIFKPNGGEFETQLLWSLCFLEVLGESAPQFLLQVSFILRFGNVDWKQIVCILASFVCIIRLVATYSISQEVTIWMKILGTLVIALGTIPKLAVCAFIVAYLRFFAFIVTSINIFVMVLVAGYLKFDEWKCLFSLFNFAVHGLPINLRLSLLQWIMIGLNMLSTALVVEFCNPFEDDLPHFHEYFWVIFFAILGGLCAISIPLELASHTCLKSIWKK